MFSDLSSLEWLALNNQYAQDASDNFEPTGNAQVTTFVATHFTGLSSLKELDLANNGITSTGLANGVFTPLESLESLALFGNPGSPFTLTNKGVRTEASVIQVVTPPTGFTVEPVSGGVKLTWDDPATPTSATNTGTWSSTAPTGLPGRTSAVPPRRAPSWNTPSAAI